ncbi:MAG TPA: DNA-formamidopyrimidine glycosylase family protein [Lapillicoccus sp.]|nr:DNA-formamidopyrimidine glycosylase family protein [Lapillicoccus sp.]
MPEGHTLHRLAQSLDLAFAGTTPAVSSPQGPFAEGAALLDGRPVTEATAYGKHLFVEFSGERWLNVHLGLIGKFSVDRITGYASVPPVWGQVRLRIVNDDYLADLRGATICQVVTPDEAAATVGRLGPDPLRADADPGRSWTKIARSGRTIAELLMDQEVLAGVGNVYRCEVLFRHRVSPFRPGKEIRRRTWDLVWADLVRLMPLGVAFNQILTMDDQVEEAERLVAGGAVPELTSTWTDSARWPGRGPAGVVSGVVAEVAADSGAVEDAVRDADLEDESESGAGAGMERRFWVYRRAGEPCRVCGSRVRTQVVAGRNLFWCGRCQRRR